MGTRRLFLVAVAVDVAVAVATGSSNTFPFDRIGSFEPGDASFSPFFSSSSSSCGVAALHYFLRHSIRFVVCSSNMIFIPFLPLFPFK